MVDIKDTSDGVVIGQKKKPGTVWVHMRVHEESIQPNVWTGGKPGCGKV